MPSASGNNASETEVRRVLMISGSFPPLQCGVGDSANALAVALAQKGIEINVLTDSAASPSLNDTDRLKIYPEIKEWGIRGTGKLTKRIESFEPDIVHIHYPSKAYGKGLGIVFTPALLRTRKRKYSIVLTLHEFRISHRARRLADFILADPCDAVVMPCYLELAAFLQRYPSMNEKITQAIPVGPVGFSPDDLTQIEREELRNSTRHKMGIGEDDILLLHYGTPSKSKGIEIIFKALRILKMEGIHPHLYIAGAFQPSIDEFHRTLAGQAEGLGIGSQVHWTGYLSSEYLSGLFAAADVGVFPFTDGFSFRRSSLITLLMWDVPIITTEPDNELPLIREQEKVKFVSRQDPKSLATALITLIGNKKALENAKSAPNPLKEMFRWDSIAERYIDLYNRIYHK